jgi:alpha-tubulin suppressor-like RCC1 family protein
MDWVAVSAGGHSAARKSDGSIWVWGSNANGQLGDGTTTRQTSPIKVGTDKDWTAVVAGGAHTLALKSNGVLWAWGNTTDGQLGISSFSGNRDTPVQVTGAANNWVAMSASVWHTLALRSDGSLWAWGRAASGQLGDGTTAAKGAPVQVGTAKDWRR